MGGCHSDNSVQVEQKNRNKEEAPNGTAKKGTKEEAKKTDQDDTEAKDNILTDDEIFDITTIPVLNPYNQFTLWFEEAKTREHFSMKINAMVLATASADGMPSMRMIQLKNYSEELGFIFFTHLFSRKGKEITENPKASALFFWSASNRQVRIDGTVELCKSQSEDCFRKWSKKIQTCASVSEQSKVVSDRKHLEQIADEAEKRYADTKVPKPDLWESYRLVPSYFEFWQGQTSGIHDRIVFRRDDLASSEHSRKGERGWYVQRLAPP